MYFWGQRAWNFYELWWRSHAGYTEKLQGWEEFSIYRPPPHSYYDRRVLKNRIIFPEDRLRAKYYRRYPQERYQYTVQSGLIDEKKYYQSPMEIFVKKQMALMNKGVSEAEAFQICVKEKEMEMEALDFEKELVKQQAQVLFGLPEFDWNKEFQEIQQQYNRAIEKANEVQKRKRRKELQELIEYKLQANDTTPISVNDIPSMPHMEIIEFIRDHPNISHLFDESIFLMDFRLPKDIQEVVDEQGDFVKLKEKEKTVDDEIEEDEPKEQKIEPEQEEDYNISVEPSIQDILDDPKPNIEIDPTKNTTKEEYNQMIKSTMATLDKLFEEYGLDPSKLNIDPSQKPDILKSIADNCPEFDENQPYYTDDTLRVLDEMKKDFLHHDRKPYFPTPKRPFGDK
jgi:hypothetical protein